MSIDEDATQALIARKQRRKRWPAFERLDVEALEELANHSSDEAVRMEIRDYLVHYRREQKGAFEVDEKKADYLERSALPIALTSFSMRIWAAGFVPFSSTARTTFTVLTFAASVGLWMLFRRIALRQVSAARRQLARLGKAD